MKLVVAPENWTERIALWLGLVPLPLAETQFAYLLARTIMAAVEVDLFEALAGGPLDEAVLAARCGTQPGPTRALLRALVAAGYLRQRGGRYANTRKTTRWLLRDSPKSMRDKMLFQGVEYDLVRHYAEYLRTGRSLEMHDTFPPAAWALYQRAMRDLARLNGAEVGWRTPVPAGARDLLDLGGSHGHFAARLCRRHPGLRAVILERPEAIESAAPLLAEEALGDRVVHRAGDILRDDLGEGAWDAVLMSQVAHHFDAEQNAGLARRVARALRPGGVFVVQEVIRPDSAATSGEAGVLLDLYFAATSASGTWSVAEIQGWQAAAGLRPRRPVWLRTLPGAAQVWACKA
jgi:SAM-dependent methyltransferase